MKYTQINNTSAYIIKLQRPLQTNHPTLKQNGEPFTDLEITNSESLWK